MKTYKKVKIEKIETSLESWKCDLCREEIETECYSADEVTVSLETGTRYPEGGSGIKYEYDVCKKCFVDKLIPWFESQGAKVTEKEWDY